MLINPYAFGPGGPTDPYFSSVVSLLHMDGTNGSLTFTDQKGLLWGAGTATTCQISTTQSKFGGASGRFAGQRTNCSSFPGFGTSDFTIEGWFRADNIATTFQSIFVRAGHAIYITGSKLVWYEGGIQVQSSTLLSNTWYHFAVTRSGTTLRLFVDGVKAATDFTSSTNYATNTVNVGANSAGTEIFTGYIDDLRTTIGVARYTANFTPPTAAYPDS